MSKLTLIILPFAAVISGCAAASNDLTSVVEVSSHVVELGEAQDFAGIRGQELYRAREARLVPLYNFIDGAQREFVTRLSQPTVTINFQTQSQGTTWHVVGNFAPERSLYLATIANGARSRESQEEVEVCRIEIDPSQMPPELTLVHYWFVDAIVAAGCSASGLNENSNLARLVSSENVKTSVVVSARHEFENGSKLSVIEPSEGAISQSEDDIVASFAGIDRVAQMMPRVSGDGFVTVGRHGNIVTHSIPSFFRYQSSAVCVLEHPDWAGHVQDLGDRNGLAIVDDGSIAEICVDEQRSSLERARKRLDTQTSEQPAITITPVD